ncbi:MAG: pimelyl-ACP methyl ester esterase BioV [Sulfurospirillaceae bacterium]|nr:pimelyl-ACP methyl ester esterase BioV [Sulfurospirillaceae bacterium]
MRYFSGFCFDGEEELFEPWLLKNDFSVAGFSYGSIQAFEYVLTCKHRVDALQLFSPAFFQNRDAKFKKLQTLSFAKNTKEYCEQFLKSVAYPLSYSLESYFKKGTSEELDMLLNYVWDVKKLQELQQKGVHIEVYLGEFDAIIDASTCRDFFLPFATVYYIKNAGHILKICGEKI